MVDFERLARQRREPKYDYLYRCEGCDRTSWRWLELPEGMLEECSEFPFVSNHDRCVGPMQLVAMRRQLSAHHLRLVLVLSAIDRGADTMLALCEALGGEWAEVDALVSELVELGKLEQVHVRVRRKAKSEGAPHGHRDADRGDDG